MRKLLLAMVFAGLTVTYAKADDPPKVDKPKGEKAKDEKKDNLPTLKVGDAAPALKASKWLQGDEVKAFENGKVYIVEFWATWCGPCIVMMPHMGELQAEFRSKGVTFVGFSAKDPNNTEEKVTALVAKRGPKLKYTFAYADDRDTYETWMKASGQNGIPCSFVVDQAGKIAYIGHPMFLDLVLPRVVAGTWKGADSKEELARTEKELHEAFQALSGPDAEASLKALQNFEDKNPALARIPYFIGPKLNLLVKAGKDAQARKMAGDVMDRALKQEDPIMLRTVSSSLRSDKSNKESLGMSLQAAQALLKISGAKDAGSLFNLAEVYFDMGNQPQAVEIGRQAVEAADSPGLRKFLEQRVKAFDKDKEEEKKEEKKQSP